MEGELLTWGLAAKNSACQRAACSCPCSTDVNSGGVKQPLNDLGACLGPVHS